MWRYSKHGSAFTESREFDLLVLHKQKSRLVYFPNSSVLNLQSCIPVEMLPDMRDLDAVVARGGKGPYLSSPSCKNSHKKDGHRTCRSIQLYCMYLLPPLLPPLPGGFWIRY